MASKSKTIFEARHVLRASRDRPERIGATRGPRAIALTATDEGTLWSVAHGWVSPSSQRPPFVSFGTVSVGNTADHADALFRDSLATSFASDVAFAPGLFAPHPFACIDLEDPAMRELTDQRGHALFAKDGVSLPAFAHGLREALCSHTAAKRLASPVLRLFLIAVSGYVPSTATANAAPEGAYVGSSFNIETMTLGSLDGSHQHGAGANDRQFVQQLLQSMSPNPFQPKR